ncbi:class I SAM-dependent methyltransferase [Stakelama tenebrarum]|uniref:Class I SAM-dependent methyltransferase n=1 Tax=Stakelama tenebrarum TaxID=2711215 RepID=A0A6G6Y472_9SPHN|nr:class I SAM-dependent methyltransferase [Sphingosinithalassobacter tenebrarum]QIG79744.1 class I SAM-dependent methyltransferase [Sphingosinithalassobacter tenebrarum]
MTVDIADRGASGCLCCGKQALASEISVVSPYLADKAWGGTPEPCRLYRCPDCDFRFYDRGLSDAEGAAYYSGYRDEAYFRERNRHEPFYTRAAHDATGAMLASDERRQGLDAALREAGLGPRFDYVLDYGGGDGTLIVNLDAAQKVSFDLSGTPGRPGVTVIETSDALPEGADLATCAQVLEHVSDPAALVADIARLLRPGGMAYLEVPDQIWRRIGPGRIGRGAMAWLSRHPRLLLAADVYGTAFRVKTGVLPPFGFVSMREHINFYSASALRELAEAAGLTVRAEGRAASGSANGSFWLIAEKPAG